MSGHLKLKDCVNPIYGTTPGELRDPGGGSGIMKESKDDPTVGIVPPNLSAVATALTMAKLSPDGRLARLTGARKHG